MLFGYMSWSRLGTSEDLTQGVSLEWSRWCSDKDYLLGDQLLPLKHYQQLAAPVLAYSFADDNWGTAEAVDVMMQAYPNLERRHLKLASEGLLGIGHFGYFKPAAQHLWHEVINWLNRR